MVCPKCHIMTQRLRRDNTLEHVCRFPGCKRFGQVVARVEIPAPIVEETKEDGTSSVTPDGATPSPQGEGLETESGETTDE